MMAHSHRHMPNAFDFVSMESTSNIHLIILVDEDQQTRPRTWYSLAMHVARDPPRIDEQADTKQAIALKWLESLLSTSCSKLAALDGFCCATVILNWETASILRVAKEFAN